MLNWLKVAEKPLNIFNVCRQAKRSHPVRVLNIFINFHFINHLNLSIMNKTIISGNVGTTKEGAANDKKVLNFTVAVNEHYNNKQGEKVTKTTWFECSLWGRENLYQYIKKGTHVLLSGTIGVNAYKIKESGEPAASLTLNVDEIEFSNRDKEEETKG